MADSPSRTQIRSYQSTVLAGLSIHLTSLIVDLVVLIDNSGLVPLDDLQEILKIL